jgi:hypothetical protein
MFNKILLANRGGRAAGAGVRASAWDARVGGTPYRVASTASGDLAAGGRGVQ